MISMMFYEQIHVFWTATVRNTPTKYSSGFPTFGAQTTKSYMSPWTTRGQNINALNDVQKISRAFNQFPSTRSVACDLGSLSAAPTTTCCLHLHLNARWWTGKIHVKWRRRHVRDISYPIVNSVPNLAPCSGLHESRLRSLRAVCLGAHRNFQL